MTKTIFDRRDKDVIKDAETLSLKDFIEKYEELTTATAPVLKSVHNSLNKTVAITQAIESNADNAVDLPEPVIEEIIIDSPQALNDFNKSIKTKQKGKTVEGGDKPGRTPRMRELIAEHGKEDKAKIKRLLEEEGYNCSTSGFHSEYNRLTKAKK